MGGLAWAFDVHKKRDPLTGRHLPVHWNDYTPLLIAKPIQFPFEAVPRSEGKAALIRDMHQAARARDEEEKEEAKAYEFAEYYEYTEHTPEIAPERMDSVINHDPGRDGWSSPGGSSIRDGSSSPEPGLSFRDSSSEEEEELESEISDGGAMEMSMMVLDEKTRRAWKANEPLLTVLEVPGAWRWD